MVDTYAEECRRLGLGTPADEELALVARKSRELLAAGKTLDDVIEACRRAAPQNAARFLTRIAGDVQRERLGVAGRTQQRENPIDRRIREAHERDTQPSQLIDVMPEPRRGR